MAQFWLQLPKSNEIVGEISRVSSQKALPFWHDNLDICIISIQSARISIDLHVANDSITDTTST